MPTQLIALSDILIPTNRQRTEFDSTYLQDLAISIESKGLLHAPVFRNDGRTLVAGECRIKVMTDMHQKGIRFSYNGELVPIALIPFTMLGELNELEVREAELEENIRRLDLSLQDRARSVAELHKLRITQHGGFDPTTGEGWTKTKTAEELNRRAAKKHDVSDITLDLLIAENLDDPFVAVAKDKREAVRAIKDRKKLEHRNSLRDTFLHSKSKHTLIQGSSYEVFSRPEYEGKFSVILTDPPYGIDAHKTTTHDNQQHDYDDSNDAFQKVCELVPHLTYRIAAPQAHIYVFCDITRFNDLFVAFELSGWNVWRRPLIWNKGNIGSYGGIDFGFRRTYDAILFANKGERPMNGGFRDVININQRTDLPHPAGKPSDLYKELLSYSVLPGDMVADLFTGHGPIFPAADALHCVATGVEMEDQYYAMAVETLSNLENGK